QDKESIARTNERHASTDWRIQPSFTFDVLCFLNVLTGDPFYLDYYKDDYAQFEPKLTPSVRTALAELKRKIKDERKGIISAFLALLFSATEDQTLDDLLNTLKNSETMRAKLKATPYYSAADWRAYESVKDELRTIFEFLKAICFEETWKKDVRPK